MPDHPSPSAVRDCLDCHQRDGMKLENTGVFTAYYICNRCGATFTVPPPPLESLSKNSAFLDRTRQAPEL